MKVAIVVNFGFPRGMASTSRARNLAMGLAESGAEVEIIVPKPTEVLGCALNHQLSGRIDGFDFRYTSSGTVIPDNFIQRRLAIMAGFCNCARYLFHERNNIDAVIFYLREISGLAFLATWCRILGICSILEICEWPVSHRNPSPRLRFQNWLLTSGSFFFVNGVIAISTFLEQKTAEFAARYKLKRPCLVVPILVKVEDYKCLAPYQLGGDLLFCGVLDQTEILLFLLKVMAELKGQGCSRRLAVTGKAFLSGNLELIKNEIQRLQLGDLVVMKGYLPQDELKALYCRSSALLAPLPSGDRSIARFPNKIGEYLASGRPVITTDIGDIPKYLTDGESAYLVQPDDVKGFAEAIIRVINDPLEAEQVGRKGFEVATKHFDPKSNGEKIIGLIKTIRESGGNQ